MHIKAYNKDLEIQRELSIIPSQNSELQVNPIISFGKNLLYVILYQIESLQLYNKMIVLDFSDKSSISIKQTHSYKDYELELFHSNSIQAYSDDTGIAHFYGQNKSKQDVMVQVLFNSKGEKKSGYPKEYQPPLTLNAQQYYWPWRSILHQDKETATFLANDNNNNLLINTFSKNGDEICSELIDITGYESKNNYYGIFGDFAWFYLQDSKNQEGHFLLFDPEICSMDLSSIGPGTGLTDGMAGGFMDYDNEKIFIVEFGNLLKNSAQKIIQSNLYQIGSLKLDEKEDKDENEDNGYSFILEFQAISAIFIALIMI
ncbi:hypothetical protein PPERSA_02708 [Pseudocohnilembus persalinus]|uniref:Uncharacterized protein n=1 Tax=Pseudocohnilembus persalinus TaxID=266149 RepID=A0A0V0R5T8_PSEPJ|nr:hypothetical protein PPERSA_02708 [Pseudocohnilembus persalinus]|eukprot:KRX09836.1 hypothetical protein PPERSA_02708 [Pseudocohnilembus persalinus]